MYNLLPPEKFISQYSVSEICALLGYHAASSGNFLLTFQYDLSIPSSRAKNSNIGKKVTLLVA